jgi:hypothetical protein
MKKIVGVLIIMLLFSETYGQETENRYKYEVGVNITPLFTKLIDTKSDIKQLDFVFNYNLKNNYSLCFRSEIHFPTSINYIEYERYGSFTIPFYTDIVILDSIKTTELLFSQSNNCFDLVLGGERKFHAKSVYFSFGLNFSFGLFSNTTLKYKVTENLNNNTSDFRYIYSKRFLNPSIGGFPYISVTIPFSERIGLTLQSGFYQKLYFKSYKTIDGVLVRKKTISYFEKHQILGYINLLYRFNFAKTTVI